MITKFFLHFINHTDLQKFFIAPHISPRRQAGCIKQDYQFSPRVLSVTVFCHGYILCIWY